MLKRFLHTAVVAVIVGGSVAVASAADAASVIVLPRAKVVPPTGLVSVAEGGRLPVRISTGTGADRPSAPR